MHKLVYIDIRTTQVRDSILKHIAENAKIQEAHNKISTKLGKHMRNVHKFKHTYVHHTIPSTIIAYVHTCFIP